MSSRGQITLPAGMRRHLGIAPGGVVIVEELDGELRLKPAEVLEQEFYSDAQIEEWDRADRLSVSARNTILRRLQLGRSACFLMPMCCSQRLTIRMEKLLS
ncbi:AbrB/MazE/SpoVT family DNA-binding domain-containing protein [Synechococcus sp. CS-1324]|uniref:AbrB/MazE/SpoVT family DNA-binding domain-containing protein n=1 Tax=Synechococcus sp. CS-1324 TaxID=2847980 RepID=UPI00223ADA32|nr:AbrB/MazE/SpoVT family DNA-binding domain-containing protein [Synechococcus sp. CS-1324]